jgi:hypothetical protein
MREDLPGLRRGSASEPNTDLNVPVKAVKREVRRCHEQVTGIDEQGGRLESAYRLSPAMNSCATCRLNSMLWERCLAMAFILRKPSSPCQILLFRMRCLQPN